MEELMVATLETLEMTMIALCVAYLLGIPLGVLTHESSDHGLFPNKVIHTICNIAIGFRRAVPYTIMMVLCLPLTRFLIGTGIGTTATIVPLSIASTPVVARYIETSLDQVDKWSVRAAKIDNTPILKIIWRVELGSRLFDIINSIGTVSISIISYTAMAGIMGGGGLGNYAIVYGYYRYDWLSVVWATLIIIFIVLMFQLVTRLISRLLDYRVH